MKNVFKMISIVMMMVTVFSCEKAETSKNVKENDTTITFLADFVFTKAGLNEGRLIWEADDQVAICDGTTVEVVTLTAEDITNGGTRASITTHTLATDAAEYYAVFPAACAYKEVNRSGLDTFITEDGSIQISIGNRILDKSYNFRSYAISSKEVHHFMFEYVDAIVYLKTERTDIASVEFKTNNSGLVMGNVLINPRTKKIYLNGYNGAHEFEYKLNGDKEAYIPVCARNTIIGGYTLTAYDSDKNVIGTISTSSDIVFESGKLYTINDFDSHL